MVDVAIAPGAFGDLKLKPEVSLIRRADGIFVLVQGRRTGADGAEEDVIFLMEVRDGNPEFLVDWEILVNYEPIPWKKDSRQF